MKTVNDYIEELRLQGNTALQEYLERDPGLRGIPVYTMANVSRAGFYRRTEGVESIHLHKSLQGDDLTGVFLHELAHAICRHFYGPAIKHGRQMFSYPIVDAQLDEVVYVANVTSTRPGRFVNTPKQREKILTAMEVFAERIILENRLAIIKNQAKNQTGGGQG